MLLQWLKIRCKYFENCRPICSINAIYLSLCKSSRTPNPNPNSNPKPLRDVRPFAYDVASRGKVTFRAMAPHIKILAAIANVLWRAIYHVANGDAASVALMTRATLQVLTGLARISHICPPISPVSAFRRQLTHLERRRSPSFRNVWRVYKPNKKNNNKKMPWYRERGIKF